MFCIIVRAFRTKWRYSHANRSCHALLMMHYLLCTTYFFNSTLGIINTVQQQGEVRKYLHIIFLMKHSAFFINIHINYSYILL